LKLINTSVLYSNSLKITTIIQKNDGLAILSSLIYPVYFVLLQVIKSFIQGKISSKIYFFIISSTDLRGKKRGKDLRKEITYHRLKLLPISCIHQIKRVNNKMKLMNADLFYNNFKGKRSFFDSHTRFDIKINIINYLFRDSGLEKWYVRGEKPLFLYHTLWLNLPNLFVSEPSKWREEMRTVFFNRVLLRCIML